MSLGLAKRVVKKLITVQTIAQSRREYDFETPRVMMFHLQSVGIGRSMGCSLITT